MKKTIILLQIAVLLLFLAKIAALGEVLKKTDAAPATPVPVSLPRPPQEVPPPAIAAEAKGAAGGNGLAKPRDLLTSLEAKRNELEKKEQFLRTEEQRLLMLKKEIVDKIDLLRAQEEKLNAAAEVQKTAENKNFKDLAKVFEAAPAAKAGVMLEQLDVKTAAGITMNMKRDKAGAIWGYLSPQKAVEITREITRSGKR